MHHSQNRSILSLAGSSTLSNPIYTSDHSNIKKLIIKLGLNRLRKMQALVRGFLTRRIIYPKVLQQYLIAKSICQLIIANSIYKQSSQIVIEAITFAKYDISGEDLIGTQNQLENDIFNTILQRSMHNHLKQIIQQSLISKAKYVSRPQITFGFNLRQPIQIVLYQAIMKIINSQVELIVGECIKEEAQRLSQLNYIDTMINQYKLLSPIISQIINQSLNEHMAQIITTGIIDKIVFEGSQAISAVCFQQQRFDNMNKQLQSMQQQLKNHLIQQAILQVILQSNIQI